MALVPDESPLRKLPATLDRRVILFLDGIRYSFEIFELASLRHAQTLQDISSMPGSQGSLGKKLVEAMADAWT